MGTETHSYPQQAPHMWISHTQLQKASRQQSNAYSTACDINFGYSHGHRAACLAQLLTANVNTALSFGVQGSQTVGCIHGFSTGSTVLKENALYLKREKVWAVGPFRYIPESGKALAKPDTVHDDREGGTCSTQLVQVLTTRRTWHSHGAQCQHSESGA